MVFAMLVEERQPGKVNPAEGLHDYRPDVDGLRAVAVLAVIANHFSSDLLPGGFLGVDMFFVISGYVITASLAKHPHHSIQDLFLGFYSRRMKRLVPALAVCVLVTCLLGSLFINPELSDYQSSLKAGLFSLFGLSNIYFYKQATDYFGASAPLNLFTQTWSLGVEEQFYLVYPAIFWISGIASRRRNGERFLLAALGLLTIVSFALYISMNRTSPQTAFYMMPPRFWELSIGCAIAVNVDRLGALTGRGLLYWPWFACTLLVLIVLVPSDHQLFTTPAIVVATAVLIATLRPEHLLYRLLTLRGVLLLGLMSYSVYLWHWSILCLSRWTIGVHWWSAPLQLGAMVALAALSYLFVEAPLRRASWSVSKIMTIGYGLTALACCAGAILVLKNGYIGNLYTGSPAQLAARGIETLSDAKSFGGKLQWRAHDCVLSSDKEVGKQIDAKNCTLEASPVFNQRKFVVIGNSFSAAEFEMYSVLSEAGLGSVIATSSWGASAVAEIPNHTPWANANRYYWSTVVPALLSNLDNGDFLIMINDLSDLTPATIDAPTEDRIDLLKNGLKRLANELRPRGIQIIFQAQNPLLREAQCTPDMAKPQWFNVGTNCVYLSKSDSIKRIQPLRKALEEVRSTSGNFHILDLFPVMCSQDICQYYDNNGVILYRDVHSHPSIEANYIARPTLLSLVDEISTSNDPVVRGH